MTIRVVLADDQAMIRAGLLLVLRAEPEIEVVAECADGMEVLQAVAAYRPDVVLMDLRMPRMDGLEATRRVRRMPDPSRVLALTTFDDDEVLWGALDAGVDGFILKDSPPEALDAAIRTVAAGGAWLDPRVAPRVLAGLRQRTGERSHSQAAELLERLTPRERQVLQLLATGATNQEIADQLHLGARTVKSHVSAVFSKLGARDRVAAVVLAHDLGLTTRNRAH